MKLNKIPYSQETNESAFIDSTTPENNTSSLATALKQGLNYRHANSENVQTFVSIHCIMTM